VIIIEKNDIGIFQSTVKDAFSGLKETAEKIKYTYPVPRGHSLETSGPLLATLASLA